MAKLKHKKTTPIKVSQTLIIKPPQRTTVGIERWRSAMTQADKGRRATLVDLYNDLLIDTVLSNAVEKRIMAITNSDIVFQINGNQIEPMMDLIDTPEFENLLEEIMKTKFYGKSIIELDFSNGFKSTSIDRRHINTESKQILINMFDVTGITYENDDFILNLGKDTDLGIFLKTAPHAIFKRNGFSDFAQFCELFGIPQLVGLYDPDDDTGRQEMETAFKQRGSAGSVVMSKNGDIKSIGENASGNVDIHDRFLNKCDEQILIGVLGQTMTTKDGSSYSQGKVHADVENDINKSDRRFVQRILNKELLPRLEKRGYPVTGGWFSFAEEGDNLTKLEQLDIAERVDAKIPIDKKYWLENFGLPKGEDEVLSDKKDIQPELENKEKETKTEVEKTNKTTALKLSFFDQLKDFFANAPR
ncbi:DUF935 family protein [Flavobacterium sp. HSC-61S13]|uniref:phage portal protein family protein n=1 Tax=Flavobacterium sp. HSC-61S13 TaxID=2910963 RepID=UPI0020A22CA6|nr:DUF935 family protein [Flavobacterium sp. HSC-61S13]MCP1997289.1 hypothetical protein [Flavobacterium sp. HSC-61S13]